MTPSALAAPQSLFEPARVGVDAADLGRRALALARSVETLEAAYTAWAELGEGARSTRSRWQRERRRLEEQGELLLGAVRAAGATATGEGLAPVTGLEDFLREARAKLEAARADLEARAAADETTFAEALGQVRAELLGRVQRQAVAVRPRLHLSVRVLPGERRILHLRKPGADEAVLLLYVLTGRVPSRYGALFDDATDDVLLEPPALYADEGVSAEEVRAPAPRLQALLAERAEVWPVKGMLPLLTGAGLVRWLGRGPVLEAEVADGERFRNLLTREEAERLTGLLLGHKLAGRVELELVRE